MFQRLIENSSVHNSKGYLRAGLTWPYIMRGLFAFLKIRQDIAMGMIYTFSQTYFKELKYHKANGQGTFLGCNHAKG